MAGGVTSGASNFTRLFDPPFPVNVVNPSTKNLLPSPRRISPANFVSNIFFFFSDDPEKARASWFPAA